MTTHTALSPAEQFRTDMMSLLDQMRGEIEEMHAEITQIRDGLTHAASQPATRAPSGMTKSFVAVAIVHSTDDNGKSCYKLRGGPYSQKGIRVWPEVLPLLGIDTPVPAGLTQLPTPIGVLVEMHDYTDPQTHETRVTPYKVIGRA